MRAALQFKNYHVLETVYKFNPFFSGEEKFEEPKLLFKLDVEPDTLKQAIIGLGVEIGEKSLKHTPYYLTAKIMGIFEIENEGLSEKQILSYYKLNGVAILFPYLRSLVSDLSSKGNEAPIILPTVNVAAMIKEVEEDDFIVSNKTTKTVDSKT